MNAVKLNTVCLGNKQSIFAPLVFLHGWGSNSKVWDLLLPRLSEQFQIVCIDLAGFDTNADVEAESLNKLLDQLLQSLPRQCHLIGWSLGGMLASELAARNPDRIVSLTTIASNAKFSSLPQWTEACAPKVFDNFYQSFQKAPQRTLKKFFQLQAKGDKNDKSCIKFLTSLSPSLEAGNQQHQQWLRALGFLNDLDQRHILTKIPKPRLAILGECDSLVPASVAQLFQTRKLYTRVELVTGAGHVPHVTAVNETASILRKFVLASDPAAYSKSKKRIATSFSKASDSYDRVAVLQRQVAKRLLGLKKRIEGRVCDIGCGTGFCAEIITAKLSELVGVDIAPGMLEICRQKNLYSKKNLICCDFDSLALAPGSFDGAVTSMSLQWSPNLEHSFSEIFKILKTKGNSWLLFSTLGPKTLFELNESWQRVDNYVHINRFESFEKVRDKLTSAGFDIVQQAQEFEQLQYSNIIDLMRDLKSIGAHNVNAGIKSGLTTRRQLRLVGDYYEQFRRAGKLPATYEVYYFLAEKNDNEHCRS